MLGPSVADLVFCGPVFQGPGSRSSLEGPSFFLKAPCFEVVYRGLLWSDSSLLEPRVSGPKVSESSVPELSFLVAPCFGGL